jgi:hypothetical protein
MIKSKTITATKTSYPMITSFRGATVKTHELVMQRTGQGRNIRRLIGVGVGLVALALSGGALQAGNIYVPNHSFESPVVPPVTPFAGPAMDDWAKSPQPFWYDPAQNFDTPWDFLMGTFYNVPNPGTFIDNCDGSQAAFLFALPEAALFQDYTSVYGTNTVPSHALNATYTVGRAYNLTVGLMGGGGGMKTGVTFQVSLYYRDAASNRVTVAATTITNTLANFPTNTHLVDFQVPVPGVKATDPWAGQNIGIQLLSTADFSNSGGYWDIDNVRLSETVAPNLGSPGLVNGQFKFTLQSEPGLGFEILATTNAVLAVSNWTSLGTLTNVTGTSSFTDIAPNSNQRYYQARQLP